MSHLGRWLSALVDGELDGIERDRALNHVAGCQSCRQEANAMRALKRRLIALGDTSAEPAIASRLIELARGDQVNPAALTWAAADGLGHLARTGAAGTRQPTRIWRLAAASAGGSLVAIGVVAFLLGNGAPAPPMPKVTPSVDSYLIQHARDAGQAPAGTAPTTSTVPGTRSAWQGGQAQARPGGSVPGQSGRALARPVSHQTTPATGTAAASPTRTAVANPVASPDASASPSSSVGQSPGPHVTSHSRG